MQRRNEVMGSIHPGREQLLVARMAKDQWTYGPPWLGEEGVARFTRPEGVGAPWSPPPMKPEVKLRVRTEADIGHGRRWPFAVKFCVFTLGPALLAAVVR